MLRKLFCAPCAQHSALLAPLTLVALNALASPAHASDVSFSLEPGVAIPLSAPQSELFDVGGAQSVKVLFGLNRYLDIGPAASFMLLPPATPGTESGVSWSFGGGLRLKRPHDEVKLHGISPWIAADASYVRTGPLNRPGFDAAVGLAIPIGETRNFWMGPFVRYSQILQLDRDGFDNHDAKTLILGLAFEFGGGIERKPVVAPPEVRVVTETRTVVQERIVPGPCLDRDNDGLPDGVDHCPDVSGPIDNFGCPKYEKVVVHADKLELKDKIQFAWNQAKLEDVSFPILDEVVRVLKDNQTFKVEIGGHTSSEGGDEHNQTLSEARAAAVLNYLVAHGIAADRLKSKGFASTVPVGTNRTNAGRESNRRVEFLLTVNIVNPATGSDK